MEVWIGVSIISPAATVKPDRVSRFVSASGDVTAPFTEIVVFPVDANAGRVGRLVMNPF